MDITPTALAAKAGISLPYASQLLSGKRHPGYKGALALWRSTGIKFGDLALLDDDIVRRIDAADKRRSA